MIFENKEAEEYYLALAKKYGYFHINCDKPISVEELDEIIDFILEKSEKENG
ncbi:hypothetical protein [Clostridium sp. DMHC 10]|uniref:hypothetical protein n=1 Tax=Clostridium sp. DMHC 10 TaxID=747377 RepID=UPI000B08606F|nr:hypothetical protein [Clostridium sp. DMHC 10]